MPPRSRYVAFYSPPSFLTASSVQSVVNSRATLASASLVAAGTLAWYTQLYGTLPFIGEAHASHLSDEGLHPVAYPWPQKGWLDTFDHARSVFRSSRCPCII